LTTTASTYSARQNRKIATLDAPLPATCSGDVICWLDKYSGSATVLLTAVLAVLTAIYVVLTWRLARTSREANENAIKSHTAVLAEAVKSRLDQQLPDWVVTLAFGTIHMLRANGEAVLVCDLKGADERTSNYRFTLRIQVRSPDSNLRPVLGWNGPGSWKSDPAPLRYDDKSMGDADFDIEWIYDSAPGDVVESWFNIPAIEITADSGRGDARDTYAIPGLRTRIDQQDSPAVQLDSYGPFTAKRDYLTLSPTQGTFQHGRVLWTR
jgi:hypothetical protein